MKLIRAEVENFGSYKHLQFSFEDLGLALLHGPTGAGKSTIMDIALWCLWGVTAKDGAVDDVRNWSNPNQTTKGTIYVRSKGSICTVIRVRGRTNDLSFTFGGDAIRGKDSTDTQRLLNEKLGCDSELFLLGSYSCESSPATRFFESKAKERRSLLERVTDLTFPNKLDKRCSESKKYLKTLLESYRGKEQSLQGAVSTGKKIIERSKRQSEEWQCNQEKEIKTFEEKNKNFEEIKLRQIEQARLRAANLRDAAEQEVRETSPRCKSCGAVDRKLEQQIRNIESSRAEYSQALEHLARTESWANPFSDMLQLEKARVNPHLAGLTQLIRDVKKQEEELSSYQSLTADASKQILGLDTLSDLCANMRSILLDTAVREVEEETNRILGTYFFGEFRVELEAEGDSLAVSIAKNGYECSFRQLSKGQKQILRLSFTVALMKRVSDQSGIQFDNLFLDEPADGADNSIKAAAFRLFQELSIGRDSVLVIDHSSDFQALFDRKLEVCLREDFSEVRDA